MEIWPTIEEFSAIMGEPDVSTPILSTIGKDSTDLAHDLLGISLAVVQQWLMLNKLNIYMVFAYISRLAVPMADRVRFNYLNVFYLCPLVRYFLVHETY